jgi:hypothetical protein
MKWLFLVHQVQTPNSRERVKVWRLTRKVGALLYRNSVYVLPYSKERLEDSHWLCQQIRDAQGEASVFVSEAHDAGEDRILRHLFADAREGDFAQLDGALSRLLNRFRKPKSGRALPPAQLKALERELVVLESTHREIRRIDFFDHPAGPKVGRRLRQARFLLSGLGEKSGAFPGIRKHARTEFRGKIWATREQIHIDRLCSAWLIKRFIDPKAQFVFVEENKLPAHAIAFDLFGVEFSHQGDRCTFETLLESFQMKDRALASMGELVHDIDLKDGKFNRPEADGIDLIVRSLSGSMRNDRKTLAIGSQILDALYERLSSRSA